MQNNQYPLVIKTLMVLLLILTSCSAAYEVVPGDDVYSGVMKRMKLENMSVKTYLWSDKKDPNGFSVAFEISEIPKGKLLKLSGLKVELIDGKTGDRANPLQTVRLSYAADTSTQMFNKVMDINTLENAKTIDLNDRVTYNFHYQFKGSGYKKFAPNMQVKFQLTIEDEGKTETINKTVNFKRVKYLNVAGN